jgi:hypothetical protein
MKSKIAVLIIVLLLTASLVQVSAQTEGSVCAPDLALTTIAELSTDDPDLDTLIAIRDFASVTITSCTGLSFGDEGAFVSDVFNIPAGVYRVNFTSSAAGSAVITPLTGECGAPRAQARSSIAGMITDTAGGEDVNVFTSEQCSVLLEVSTRGAWSLAFEFMADN